MRRVISFACAGETLVGTLDEAPGATALLIVSGGNEIRIGAHRGMAALARRIAAAGHPVCRFDRRGIGDSSGINTGYATSGPDITAAAGLLRREMPHVTRIVALGNCDAATALASFAGESEIDALILTNPWTGDDGDGLPPAAAIRNRYAQRLRDPATWRRMLRGGVDLRKLVKGLVKVSQPAQQDVATRMAVALASFPGPVSIVLAAGDATAQGFAACWRNDRYATLRARHVLAEIATASHSFQHAADADALLAIVLAAL